MKWIIDPPELGEQGHRIQARIRHGERRWEIYFRCPILPLSNRLEAFISLAALPAMLHGDHAIQVNGKVDPIFLANLEKIFTVFSQRRRCQPIKILGAETGAQENTWSDGVATLFSLGVDSWYTTLLHEEELTDLILILGYDVPLEEEAYAKELVVAAENAAQALKKRLVLVETNARAFISSQHSWTDGQSAVSAAAIHLLSGHLQRMYFPSTYTYNDMRSSWSRPVLEPYWSGSSVEFLYDGADANRFQKTQRLVSDHRAMGAFRVCHHIPKRKFNCGKCSKCLVNLANLRACGVVEGNDNFEQTLDLKRLSGWKVVTKVHLAYLRETVEYLRAQRNDPELLNALESLMRHPMWLNWIFHKWDDLLWFVRPPKRFKL